MAGGFLSRHGLIGVACGAAMTEACLLVAFAPAARSLAPQLTALPPLAIFHDLRWLYSEQPSWLGFALQLAGLLLARAALNTVLVRLAWPAQRTPLPPLAALRSAIVVTAFAIALISPLVSLTFGVAILPFSWPFLALLPAMLLIALPLSHAGVAGMWWRTLPTPAAAGWLLAEFTVLTLMAAATSVLPVACAVPMAGLAGLVNARAWYGLTAAAARSLSDPVPGPLAPGLATGPASALATGPAFAPTTGPAPDRAGTAAGGPAASGPAASGPVTGQAVAGPFAGATGSGGLAAAVVTEDWAARRVPAAPLALAAVLAIVIALTRLVFVLGGNTLGQPTGSAVALMAGAAGHGVAAELGHPVLEVAGFGSWCCGQDRALVRALPGIVVQQFSYRGTNAKGQPLPYGAASANLRLSVLGDRLAAQVWRLHAETGKPIDLVAESEGTLGVDAMFARHPGVPVSSVVLLSPIVAPGQAGFRGAAGSSVVTVDELDALVWFVGGLSPFGSSGAQTLINSVNNVGARFAAAAAKHVRVRWLEVVPLADAVTLPTCPLPQNVVVVPAFHGELLGDPAALRAVRRFLAHRPVAGMPALKTTAELMAAAASAWRMPTRSAPSPPCRP